MAALSRRGRGSLRFFTGGEAAGDRRAEGEEKKRIMDYLQEPDDGDRDLGGGEEMETGKSKRRDLCSSPPLSASSSDVSSTGSSCYSPRHLFSRWFLPLQKLSPSGGGGGGEGEAGSGLGHLVRFPMYYRKNKKKKEKEKEVVGPSVSEVVGPSVSEVVAGNGTKLSVSSGEKPEDLSLNLGMGAGLVFLLTKCAAEFKRMTKMHAKMELLLKEIKDEVQRKDIIYSFLESSNDVTFSAPDCSGDVSTNKAIPSQSHITSFHQEGEKCATDSDGKSNYMIISEDQRCLTMDQLEAELEIELERMQLNLEIEDSSVPLGEHKIVLASESSDSSESLSFGQDIEPEDEDNGEYCGVSAFELERKLHELLHTREQQRIAELEYALECTKRKLVEKEIEICWLRDRASLALPYKNGTIPVSIKTSTPFDHPCCRLP